MAACRGPEVLDEVLDRPPEAEHFTVEERRADVPGDVVADEATGLEQVEHARVGGVGDRGPGADELDVLLEVQHLLGTPAGDARGLAEVGQKVGVRLRHRETSCWGSAGSWCHRGPVP